MEGMEQSSSPNEEACPTEAEQYDNDYSYNSGIVSRTLAMGKAAANLGFYIASKSTSVGVGIARGAITTTASIGGILTGNIALVGILYGVDTTVGAAERIAQAAIYLTHTLTAAGIDAASATMEHSGAARSIDRGMWRKMQELSNKLMWQDHTDSIAKIIQMVSHYTEPLSQLSKAEISACIKRYALLQQSRRLRVVIPRIIQTQPKEDISRCMGLAAASYGRLAMNFLQYLPRGEYQSDILSALAPGVSAADIVIQTQQESVFQPGYILLIDHAKKDIVLSVRGTYSPHDVLTDLTCHHASCNEHFDLSKGAIPEETQTMPINAEVDTVTESNLLINDVFNIIETGDDVHFAHEGFLQSALRLNSLLSSEISRLVECHPGYGLLICGHSLGAGVAALLTILWTKTFPHVRCVALSPPCVLTLEAARSVSDRVTSVVVGDDMVARFGIGTSLDLRDACLHLHKSCNDGVEKISDTDLINTLRERHMTHPKLYPPGQIIHIVEKNEFMTGSFVNGGCESTESTPSTTPLKKCRGMVAYITDQLTFSEIQISGSMFSSHMPHNVLETLQEFFPSPLTESGVGLKK